MFEETLAKIIHSFCCLQMRERDRDRERGSRQNRGTRGIERKRPRGENVKKERGDWRNESERSKQQRNMVVL